MVTVTDFDERREVPADRVLELARRGAAQLAPAGRVVERAGSHRTQEHRGWFELGSR